MKTFNRMDSQLLKYDYRPGNKRAEIEKQILRPIIES
jgi:hypothetical protein